MGKVVSYGFSGGWDGARGGRSRGGKQSYGERFKNAQLDCRSGPLLFRSRLEVGLKAQPFYLSKKRQKRYACGNAGVGCAGMAALGGARATFVTSAKYNHYESETSTRKYP